jgi:hypothetical protein
LLYWSIREAQSSPSEIIMFIIWCQMGSGRITSAISQENMNRDYNRSMPAIDVASTNIRPTAINDQSSGPGNKGQP